MNYEQLISSMTPAVHAALKRAIEIGKWPDGRMLTAEQKALCMEAVIAYDQRYIGEDSRVGFIDRGSKRDGEMCGDDPAQQSDAGEKPLKWT